MQLSRLRPQWLLPPITVIIGLIALVFLVYWPGRTGSFIFDDIPNLAQLGRYGPIKDSNGAIRFLLSGIADPLGRPITSATFLLNARDWPASPLPFKLTNIGLHALNGCLLFLLCMQLLVGHVQDKSRVLLAAFCAAFWALHPLWISTVLYVIQRQTVLSATFALLGMCAWLVGTRAFAAGHKQRGWLSIVVAFFLCVPLSALSKSNGLLLPLYYLIIDTTVLRNVASKRPRIIKIFNVVCSVGLVASIAYTGLFSVLPVHERAWSIGDRLASEGRAIWSYLWSYVTPGRRVATIFTDDFPASRGFFHPWSGIVSAAFILFALLCSWLIRKRASLLSLAVLIFFAGHLMESTVIPLELYFEHRNYLPMAFLGVPIASWLATRQLRPSPRVALALMCIALVAVITHRDARIWGNDNLFASRLAQQSPNSPRAQALAANVDVANGQFHQAETRLLAGLSHRPLEPQYVLSLTELRCAKGRLSPLDLRRLDAVARNNGLALDVLYHWMTKGLRGQSDAACAGLPQGVWTNWANASLVTTSLDPEVVARQHRVLGLVALREKSCPAAARELQLRLAALYRPEFVSEQTAELATNCGPQLALTHLDAALKMAPPVIPAASPMLKFRDWWMQRDGYWSSHFAYLRTTLMQELQAVRNSAPETQPIRDEPYKPDETGISEHRQQSEPSAQGKSLL